MAVDYSDAECLRHDPETWFPFPSDHAAIELARALCLECLAFARCNREAERMLIDEPDLVREGMRAGQMGEDRYAAYRRERRRRREGASAPSVEAPASRRRSPVRKPSRGITVSADPVRALLEHLIKEGHMNRTSCEAASAAGLRLGSTTVYDLLSGRTVKVKPETAQTVEAVARRLRGEVMAA